MAKAPKKPGYMSLTMYRSSLPAINRRDFRSWEPGRACVSLAAPGVKCELSGESLPFAAMRYRRVVHMTERIIDSIVSDYKM
jgi:hypothetical protein